MASLKPKEDYNPNNDERLGSRSMLTNPYEQKQEEKANQSNNCSGGFGGMRDNIKDYVLKVSYDKLKNEPHDKNLDMLCRVMNAENSLLNTVSAPQATYFVHTWTVQNQSAKDWPKQVSMKSFNLDSEVIINTQPLPTRLKKGEFVDLYIPIMISRDARINEEVIAVFKILDNKTRITFGEPLIVRVKVLPPTVYNQAT